MLKILYLGNFQPNLPPATRFSTEWHIAKTLESLGHSIIYLQEDQVNNTHILYQETLTQPDFFLWTRTPGFFKDDAFALLDELTRRNIPSVSIHLDLYAGIKRGEDLDFDAFWETDYVFSADGGSEEFFKRWGVNHFWLKPGVYDKECYIATPDYDRFPHEIIFVGSDGSGYHFEWGYRKILTDWLKTTYGWRFKVWPGIGVPAIRGNDLNTLYSSAKLSIGDTLCLGFNHEKYTSDRLYEGYGRGSCQIYPRIKGITDEWEDGKNIILYNFGDFDELKSKIEYYLDHDTEREAIRQAGFKFVKEKHTYVNRMNEMLNVLVEHEPKIKEKL